MTRQRRYFSPEEKVALLKRHLLEKVAVADLCDQHQIAPNNFYQWQKQFFENGAAAFQNNGRNAKRSDQAHERKIAQLEEKLVRKNEVVAELMEEHVQLKKVLGEL